MMVAAVPQLREPVVNMISGMRLLLLTLVTLLLTWGAAAGAERLDPDLVRHLAVVGGGEPVAVIIEFDDRVDTVPFARRSDRSRARSDLVHALRDKARNVQGPLQGFLRSRGFAPSELWISNALAVSVPAAEVASLAAWPGVETVRLDQQYPPPEAVPMAAPTGEPTWNIAAVGAPALWAAGLTGQNAVVAVFDTGVNRAHPDLAQNWRGGSNSWFDPYGATTLPYDPVVDGFTHGTAVASLIVGRDASGRAIGVAPDARWIAAKIFPDSGSADNSRIIQAFQWALDPDGNPATDDAPDVVNNSWGLRNNVNQCLPQFRNEIQVLQAAGIAVVFSAGNAGPGESTSISPPNLPEGLAVGSVGANHLVTRSSSRGPSACAGSIYDDLAVDVFPELTAPGEVVLVANGSSSYALVTGTSFSAPHVSGALALLAAAFPGATRQQLELALLRSATDLGVRGADNSYGRGLLTVVAARARLEGTPFLNLYDPSPPEDDETVAFGSITPGASRDLTLALRNVGGAALGITAVDAAGLAPPFSLAGNDCPASLPPDGFCNLTLRFAPEAPGGFSAALEVVTSDPQRPLRTVVVSGFGNAPPPPPFLLAPPDGAANLARPVVFEWIQGLDPDGDPLAVTLLISPFPSFPDGHTQVFAVPWPDSLPAMLPGLALLLIVGAWRSRRPRRIVALLGVVLLIGSACGGGGGGGGGGREPLPEGVRFSRTVTTVEPNATYYWKVRVDDGQGGVVDSVTREFTTGP